MSTKSISANRGNSAMNVKKMSILAMFIALGYLCLFVFRFKVTFLTLDFKDVFITMAGFVYGPIAALAVALTETLLELATISDTGFWGALMNFVGSAAFAVTASLIYKFNKTFKGAVIGLVAAVFSMTAVMMPMNILITPIYAHTDAKTVVSMIPKLLLPFNLIKGMLNASIAFILYKPLSQALRATGMLPKSSASFSMNRRSLFGLLAAAAVIVASVVLIFTVFDGSSFEIVKQ
ncbi:Riboflavin transporter FmnP [Ruminococcaceae bacterium FB2012]|nr:Riboflavin transporter FmnP [Ruminococcaceae bacterium FB2012]